MLFLLKNFPQKLKFGGKTRGILVTPLFFSATKDLPKEPKELLLNK